MALMHGKSGNIYWDCDGNDTELQHAQSWSLDAVHDVVEVTSMQDSWGQFFGGFADWTATVECLLDSTGLDIPLTENGTEALGENTPAKLELYFVYDAVTPSYKAIYGSAVCTGVTPAAAHDGAMLVTYMFTGQGTLTWHSGASLPTY